MGFGQQAGWPQVLVWRAPEYQVQIVGDGAAYALNDDDLAVGAVATDPSSPWGDRTARLWNLRTCSTHPLLGLDGTIAHGTAVDINNAGVLVGALWTPGGRAP